MDTPPLAEIQVFCPFLSLSHKNISAPDVWAGPDSRLGLGTSDGCCHRRLFTASWSALLIITRFTAVSLCEDFWYAARIHHHHHPYLHPGTTSPSMSHRPLHAGLLILLVPQQQLCSITAESHDLHKRGDDPCQPISASDLRASYPLYKSIHIEFPCNGPCASLWFLPPGCGHSSSYHKLANVDKEKKKIQILCSAIFSYLSLLLCYGQVVSKIEHNGDCMI